MNDDVTAHIQRLNEVAAAWQRGYIIKRCGTVATWDGLAYPFADWLRDRK